MLKNLDCLLKNKGITKKAYASCLNLSTKAIQKKIAGESAFTFPEALKTQSLIFPEYRLEFIFQDDLETS